MSSVAHNLLPVVSRSEGRITFKVDDVEPVISRLETEPVSLSMARRMSRRVIARSAGVSVVGDDSKMSWRELHPFVHAVHRAFSEHRPLELSPDDFAVIIAQGIAHHVHCHPENLRNRLVDHEGKNRIIIHTDVVPQTPEDWEMIVGAFSDRLRDVVNPDIADALRCDYSTTTPAIRVAAEIAMMQAFDRYFDFILLGICGIPEVTLHGTTADWERLLRRAEKLAVLDLDWWTARLLPILHEVLATAAGNPGAAFWRAICKPREAYGPGVITGWMTDLFPYLGKAASRRNYTLEWPRVQWVLLQEQEKNHFTVRGLAPDSFPNGLSEARLQYGGSGEQLQSCQLVGGFMGVEQTERASLRTHIGWAVTGPDEIVRILDQIASEGWTVPVAAGSAEEPRSLDGGPAFMMAFQERFGKAVLFPGSEYEWELGRMEDCRRERSSMSVFALRRDGVVLACAVEVKGQEPGYAVYAGRLPDPESFRRGGGFLQDVRSIRQPQVLEEPTRLGDDFTEVISYLLAHDGRLPLPADGQAKART